MTRIASAMMTVFLTTGSAFADVSSPFPLLKDARAIHRIETTENFPDHVFILYRCGFRYDARAGRWDQYDEWEYVEVTPDRPLVIELARPESGRRTHGQRAKEHAVFGSIPRSLAEKYTDAKEASRAAGLEQRPGMISEDFDWREMVPSWAGSEITLTYRVQRKANGGGLELVRTSWNPRWQWNAAAILLTVSVILVGLWVIRWIRWAGKSAQLMGAVPPPR